MIFYLLAHVSFYKSTSEHEGVFPSSNPNAIDTSLYSYYWTWRKAYISSLTSFVTYNITRASVILIILKKNLLNSVSRNSKRRIFWRLWSPHWNTDATLLGALAIFVYRIIWAANAAKQHPLLKVMAMQNFQEESRIAHRLFFFGL